MYLLFCCCCIFAIYLKRWNFSYLAKQNSMSSFPPLTQSINFKDRNENLFIMFQTKLTLYNIKLMIHVYILLLIRAKIIYIYTVKPFQLDNCVIIFTVYPALIFIPISLLTMCFTLSNMRDPIYSNTEFLSKSACWDRQVSLY